MKVLFSFFIFFSAVLQMAQAEVFVLKDPRASFAPHSGNADMSYACESFEVHIDRTPKEETDERILNALQDKGLKVFDSLEVSFPQRSISCPQFANGLFKIRQSGFNFLVTDKGLATHKCFFTSEPGEGCFFSSVKGSVDAQGQVHSLTYKDWNHDADAFSKIHLIKKGEGYFLQYDFFDSWDSMDYVLRIQGFTSKK